MRTLLAALAVALLFAGSSFAQQEQEQPQPQQQQGCGVVVVNALAIPFPLTIQVANQTVEGLAPGECELFMNVPCGEGSNELPVRLFAQRAEDEGEEPEENPEGDAQQCPLFVSFVNLNTAQQQEEQQPDDPEQQEGEQQQEQPQQLPEEEQQQVQDEQEQQPEQPQYIHYIVVSHRIQLQQQQQKPASLIGSFPLQYQNQDLPIALIYDRAALPQQELQEGEVALAFWHTAAGTSFPVDVELRGTQQQQGEGEGQGQGEGEGQGQGQGQGQGEGEGQGQGQGEGEGGAMVQQRRQVEEQQDQEGQVLQQFTLEPYQREDWMVIPQNQQVEAILVMNATQPQQDQQQQQSGQTILQQNIQQEYPQFSGQLVTGFIITPPPELQQQEAGEGEGEGEGQDQPQRRQEQEGMGPTVFFTNCATEYFEMVMAQQQQQPDQQDDQPQEESDVAADVTVPGGCSP